MTKLCREAWAWLSGACSAGLGYMIEQDPLVWLGALVMLLTAADRCYEILIKCRHYRRMGADD